jgi:hypothetical protein
MAVNRWNVQNWLKKQGVLVKTVQINRFHKMWKIYWPAEPLLTTQGLSSIELRRMGTPICPWNLKERLKGEKGRRRPMYTTPMSKQWSDGAVITYNLYRHLLSDTRTHTMLSSQSRYRQCDHINLATHVLMPLLCCTPNDHENYKIQQPWPAVWTLSKVSG